MQAIVLFVKHPVPGRVKTRLAATIGAQRAAEIYRELVERTCGGLPERAELIVMFDPPDRGEEIAQWLRPLCGKARFLPQSGGDLGTRLEHAFADAFALQLEKVAIIGSDCVEVTSVIFDEAWQALEHHDCAIGPTEDGGYYLIALRRECPGLFRSITWSTEAVLAETLARANLLGLSVHVLPRLHDVDTEDDWHRLKSRLSR
jgi:rSAM/selenodomain-associated transferase 1